MERESFKKFSKRLSQLEEFSQGWRGKIFTAYLDGERVAVKMPKSKEFLNAINKEAEILQIVNKHNIGNKLVYVGKDFFAYKFIEGKHFRDVLNKNNYRKLLFQLLEQGRVLDRLKISKDELHKPHTNVLVDKNDKLYLIDFERAKITEKPQNITQILQFIMGISQNYFPELDKQKLIELAKRYKREQTEKNFSSILKYLNF